ncbi:MAG: hypothetical protein IPL90_19485 [Holophagales bacterium]|nr:hypothetical protein [Holophagales bacterium]
MSRKATFVALALLPLLAVASAPFPGADAQAVNATAIHDPESSSYRSDCLTCHAAILKETSQDPRVQTFHNAMLPFTPGYNPRKGAQNTNCVFCHRAAVDFTQESGAELRRTVSVEACVSCHSRSGPGPVYYK